MAKRRGAHDFNVKARAPAWKCKTPARSAENPGCVRLGWAYVGSVNWQQVVSLIIVAVAAAALLWGWIRRRKFRFDRDTHCGCGTSSQQGSIIFHARKGERSQVLVKMK
jgi:hypothetical protein